MQSTHRVILFIIATLLFAYLCTTRHSMFETQPNGLLPAISALLVVGRLQPMSSLVNHASSASLQLTRLYTPLLLCLAFLGYHAADAKLLEVTKRNFKHSPYYGSPVSLKGDDIFFTLDERASQVSVIWNFKSSWHIQLEKCDAFGTAKIEIADSCKWGFRWEDKRDFALTTNDNSSPAHAWTLPEKPPIRKLQIQILMEFPTDIDARLLYDFYEPTIMPPTWGIRNYTINNVVPLWTGRGPPPPSYVKPPGRYVRPRKMPNRKRATRAPRGGGKSQYDAVGGGVSGFVLITIVSFGCVARLVYDI
ncbi:hypothetical protein AAVH_09369 [Aphelenchoides avenae]|nr:hypothetical protein AAVH_09369 [Aphelenchus avenae]